MLVIKLVGKWNMRLVPSVVASFITADKENRNAARIKSIQNSVWASTVLYPQLPHMRMS